MANIELVAEVTFPLITASPLLSVSIEGGPGNPRDFVSVYNPSARDDSGPVSDWKYLSNNSQTPRPTVGRQSGNVTLDVRNITGAYEIRFYNVRGEGSSRVYTVLGRSPPIMFTSLTIKLEPPADIPLEPEGNWVIDTTNGYRLTVVPFGG